MEERRINYKPAMPEEKNNSKMMRLVGILIVIVCVASLSFAGGRVFEQGSRFNVGQSEFSKEDFNSSLFWDVWGIIESDYVDEEAIDSEKMFYGAIRGMVDSLDDPSTVFLNSEETENFRKQTQGKHFEGIGAELGYRDGVVIIISPLDGSPAKAAGLLPGAVILSVDGEDIQRSDSIYDVVKMIRGEKGTEVVLEVVQGDSREAQEIKIVREEITIPSMSLEDTDYDDIYKINLGRFTESTAQVWNSVWDDVVEEFLDTGAENLIVDLRSNPGGFFDSGVYAAGDFLPRNTVVAKQEDRQGNTRDYKVSREPRLSDVEVVVLVNQGSASASEIFAGALQEHGRAKIVGVETYGKGTAQQVIDLYDGSSLHLTVVKWLLPDGSWINPENVIIPDVEIELTQEDFEKGDDPQLEKAFEVLGK